MLCDDENNAKCSTAAELRLKDLLMAMRIDIEFAHALTADEKTNMLLAVASLAKSSRVFVGSDRRHAVVMGNAIGRERVKEVLSEFDVPWNKVVSSLNEEEEQQVDETLASAKQGKERLRPIGR